MRSKAGGGAVLAASNCRRRTSAAIRSTRSCTLRARACHCESSMPHSAARRRCRSSRSCAAASSTSAASRVALRRWSLGSRLRASCSSQLCRGGSSSQRYSTATPRTSGRRPALFRRGPVFCLACAGSGFSRRIGRSASARKRRAVADLQLGRAAPDDQQQHSRTRRRTTAAAVVDRPPAAQYCRNSVLASRWA